MRQSRAKYFGITVLILLISIIAYSGVDHILRCSKEGKSEKQALEIANKLILLHYAGDFDLENIEFDYNEKEWSLSYRQTNSSCKIDIIIDRCGGFFNAGITEACVSIP